MSNLSIKDLNLSDLNTLFNSINQPKFRIMQLTEWLYGKQVEDFNLMTNLPYECQSYLSSNFVINKICLVDKQISKDGTTKYLFKLPIHKKLRYFESVAIPSENGFTLCLSSQVGCPMGCLFCATGQQGYKQNLSMGNIIDQVLFIQKDLNIKATNIVMMGQGEPFLNYDNVMDAVSLINNQKIIGIGARKITISTCGIIPEINKFASIEKQYTLAVSLHSAIQSTRDQLMPGVKKFPLVDLKTSLVNYIKKTNRRLTLEYIMLKDLNTSSEHLNALLQFCNELLCHINFIKLNKIPNSQFKGADDKLINEWIHKLNKKNIEATIRNSKGTDIDAACGQLLNSQK